MDQEKQPRVVINVRVRESSKQALELRARSEGVTASDLHRRMLAYAMLNMPNGWGK